MAFWDGEIKELGTLYDSFKGHLPDIVKELEQLVKTDDPNVVMLYSRRCLEVIVTDLCENELKRPRKTEPLKGIIDKLNAEEKVPSHIITSMISLNSMANYGAHPKDFDPEQVKPVLNNLAIIIRWYLKYKDFKIVSKAGTEEKEQKFIEQPVRRAEKPQPKKKKSKFFTILRISLGILLLLFLALMIFGRIIGLSRIPSYVPASSEATTFIDTINFEIYSEIRIGTQIWMGENLRSEKFTDGTPIPLVKNGKEWQETMDPAYCWYNNEKKIFKPTPYGPLYNWFAVNSGKLCPSGWHVPTRAEWDTLFYFVGDSVPVNLGYLPNDSESAGMKLKESGNNNWAVIDTIYSTNEFGFTALPAGMRTIYGVFWGISEDATFWTADEEKNDVEKDDAESVQMNHNSNGIFDPGQYKKTGMSVRCVKDDLQD